MKSNQLMSPQNVRKRIRELREESEDLADYLDLLEVRARNRGKKRYGTEQVKRMLGIKEAHRFFKSERVFTTQS